MEAHDHARTQPKPSLRLRPGVWRALVGGGPEGNEELTTIAGAILIVLLAVLGITIIRIGQLLWLHLFLGLLLLGPIVVKMASTAYRFVRYYTHDAVYRTKGPPEPIARAIAPIVVASTIVVFVTGIVLLGVGVERERHARRDPQGELHRLGRVHGPARASPPACARAGSECQDRAPRGSVRLPAPPAAGSCWEADWPWG